MEVAGNVKGRGKQVAITFGEERGQSCWEQGRRAGMEVKQAPLVREIEPGAGLPSLHREMGEFAFQRDSVSCTRGCGKI